MKSLKPFGGSATGSRVDPFVEARWKLTGLYVLILAFVVVLLSWTLFTVHGIQVREQTNRDRGEPRTESQERGSRGIAEPKLEEYLEALGRSIVWLDAGTILLGGLLSYWLAGRTLRPIRDTVQAEQGFFAGAAHDLRTPLSVMRTEIDVALRNPAPTLEEVRQTFESALEEIARMATLVDEMLFLATSGHEHRGVAELQDVSDLVATAVDRLQSRAASAGIRLSMAPAEPVVVKLLPGTLDRALANVLENGLKFTPPGGSVEVSVSSTRSHIDIVVADTGVGIRPEDLPRVTLPFFRADSARTTPGSGLGLSIVEQILKKHRGSVELTSAPGRGTRVRLRLPR